jgi:hypothetical protein
LSFSTGRWKQIIMACIALHNFIHDRKLYDKEFVRCDANREYIARASNALAQTQGGDEIEGEN